MKNLLKTIAIAAVFVLGIQNTTAQLLTVNQEDWPRKMYGLSNFTIKDGINMAACPMLSKSSAKKQIVHPMHWLLISSSVECSMTH